MSPAVVIITIIAYFALLMAISYRAGRGANNSTFFTGGRRMPWAVVAFAMIGAAISGVTFISVPGMVATKGYAYLQMVLGFIVGYVVIALVLVPLFYRLNLTSIYAYLAERFGNSSHRAGAVMFFISKMLGAAVRFFVVCAVLQILVFDPLNVPFTLNVLLTIALIWLYTWRGGVKTLIWTDLLKSFCLIISVILCIYYIADNMGMGFSELSSAIASHHSAQIWYFDDPRSGSYFWKQFIAGVFMAIATNGLDQDMMQRHLSCPDSRSSRKNMIVSGVMQFFVIALFLLLGTLMLIYAERTHIELPQKSDEFFGLIATHPTMPVIVGILFVIGLISAAYSAAASALTALTTSFTLDIMRRHPDAPDTSRVRRRVHLLMSAIMGAIIIAFYYLSTDDAISAVYTLASYTYGPILGLFAFGIFFRHRPADRMVPWICAAAPALSWCLQRALLHIYNYTTGFELLLINAAITMAGLYISSLFVTGKYVKKPA